MILHKKRLWLKWVCKRKDYYQNDSGWQKITTEMIVQKKWLLVIWFCRAKDCNQNNCAGERFVIKIIVHCKKIITQMINNGTKCYQIDACWVYHSKDNLKWKQLEKIEILIPTLLIGYIIKSILKGMKCIFDCLCIYFWNWLIGWITGHKAILSVMRAWGLGV